jgi:hypothetical protein
MFDPVMPASEGGKVLDVEARFALETFGVAAYQAQSGILAERVWVVKGTSEGGVSAPHFWHAGQLVLLGDSDHPDLGQTGLVAGPGRVIDGLPAWPPLEMFQL